MARRFVTSVIGLVLAAFFVAGGAVCSGTTGTSCCCCLAAGDAHRSSTAAPCCEAVCRKAPNNAPAGPTESTAQSSTPEPSAPAIRVHTHDDQFTALLPVALKTAATAVAHHDPPEVFLQKAVFLI